ncbi:MAG: hypothetical protein HS116_18375 [Planctomycetes bacterium]|nr:hypothetical protein [Planctomycetota bacterium]
MRFRLATLWAACLTAAVWLGINLVEREIEPGMWDDGSYQEAPAYYPPAVAQGWPAVVYEIRQSPFDRRVYWEPWAIGANAVLGLGCVAATAVAVEWLLRRFTRPKKSIGP